MTFGPRKELCTNIYALMEVAGSLCNCFLPENIKVTAVGHLPTHPEFSGKFLIY